MIGIDEVGRGAWAGPLVVVAARIKDGASIPALLSDSKLLSKSNRELLMSWLEAYCSFGEAWIAPADIDALGLSAAMYQACSLAIEALGFENGEEIVIDGTVNYLSSVPTSRTLVKADSLIPVVSAASVYAKVIRDTHMGEVHKKYPQYGFNTNVGYGTRQHIEAIRAYGVLPIHRQSYKPLRSLRPA